MAKLKDPPLRTSGILAAALTPVRDDGSADAPLLAAHCRSLFDEGCSGVVLLGTTGEANSFTTAERQALLEGVLKAGVPAESLIVGTGCCAIGDTVTLTRHALSAGVSRTLLLPPFYYKKASDDGLFAAYAQVIERVADHRLRVYVYRIPQMTGIDISLELLERLYGAFPAVLAGIKDSSGDWATTEALCRRLGSKIDVLVGNETLLVRGLAAGAAGCVTATANVNARAIAELLRKRSHAEAATLEREVKAYRAAFEAFGIIPAMKAYLARTTGVAWWRNVRPPLVALTDPQVAKLVHSVK
jgi:4-hydroxy-tetrahydrodipicolinate synthase